MSLDLEKIKDHIPRLIDEDKAHKAAVCIALIETADDYDIVLEVRSGLIPRQPGDVCLPGGGVEPGESYQEAAVRETCEELLIQPDQIKIIGASDIMHNKNMLIYPYVGILTDYEGTFNEAEVAEVFRVPVRFFEETKPGRFVFESTSRPDEGFPFKNNSGGRDHQWRVQKTEEFYYEYEGHIIWGLTAHILRAFLSIR
ncbi:MAG: CoA pyrophosphatase [Lachnospiraceae bacterium]|nr:CoA pyrophosphatase [Lachnospiraceae bacterium]